MLLAEKIETAEEFEHARRLGYDLFQGFFFARPTVMKGRDVPAIRQNYLRLLQALASPDVTVAQLEAVIKPELSIAYRLLRHVNSAAFGLRRQVESVAQALVLIGSSDVRKWASVWSLAALGTNKPEALILLAATRGRFCELLGEAVGLSSACSELFLMGMFSLLDAIVDRPIDQALSGLALPDLVRTAIVDRTGVYSPYLETALAYERGDWDELARSSQPLDLTPAAVRSAYLSAARWAQQTSAS
jgi:EAL and modified HD-GYP domain-containing signal transduction protein